MECLFIYPPSIENKTKMNNPAPQDFIAQRFHHAVISSVLDGFNLKNKNSNISLDDFEKCIIMIYINILEFHEGDLWI